jgi:hypothetical protein
LFGICVVFISQGDYLCSATMALSLSMFAPVSSATLALAFRKMKVGIAVIWGGWSQVRHKET